MTKNLKLILKANVERLMEDLDLRTAKQLAARCYWPRGRKKGENIAQRTIAYIFETEEDSPSPSLDLVEALSVALNADPWELLTENDEARRAVVEKIIGVRKVTKPEYETQLTSPTGQEAPLQSTEKATRHVKAKIHRQTRGSAGKQSK